MATRKTTRRTTRRAPQPPSTEMLVLQFIRSNYGWIAALVMALYSAFEFYHEAKDAHERVVVLEKQIEIWQNEQRQQYQSQPRAITCQELAASQPELGLICDR